ILLWIKKHKKYNGSVFLSFLILYSISRFTIEFFRFSESNKILNYFTIAQIICLVVIFCSLIYMNILKKRKQN
ncbi:MAG: prolipoprotein diacylglyceryl transferase, partial [Candidatus Infernicultor aquiphilus]